MNWLVIGCLGLLGLVLFDSVGDFPTREAVAELGRHYLASTPEDVGVPNVVAAVLFDYRMLDTLGETSVVFAAVAGIVLLFHRRVFENTWVGLSFLPRWGLRIFAPVLFTYGAYLVMHGHLGPGGGFQGGVVWATLSILMAAAYGAGFEANWLSPTRKTVIECAAALGMLLIAGVGLVKSGYAFANLKAGFPAGVYGTLFSGGSLPLLNLLSGLKVGSGLSIIFLSMVKKDVEWIDS